MPHDNLYKVCQLYNLYIQVALVLKILRYLKIARDRSYLEGKLDKLDKHNDLNVTDLQSKYDEASVHS
jgi:hypothetical protein